MDDQQIRCGQCRFFQPPPETTHRFGQCRRCAPVSKFANEKSDLVSWPAVEHDEWCGEARPSKALGVRQAEKNDSAIRKAGNPPHPLVRDPATGDLGVKVGIVRELRDCASTVGDPEREAKIKAWHEEALTVESGEEPFGQGYFLLRRSEITAAVALMRGADGKALLRELRAWMVDKARMQLREGLGWSFEVGHINLNSVVERIDEMLARPEPSTVYSRGKTIAESADPPTAYYPPAPVEQPDATTSRFDERASELRAMLSWIEYQPCLRDGLAGEVVRSYLTAKIKELEDQRPVDGETGGNWRGN